MSDLFAAKASTYRPMRAKFLADANFDLVILVAAKRRELAFDYQTALEAGLIGQQDPGVLAIAAREGRVLLTHDVRTMPQHFASFIGEHTSAGVLLVPQSLTRRHVVEDLLLIWTALEAEEWTDRIMSLPL
jgi:predicted nuclease of predicted toxin-antitoxin system